MGSLQGGSTRVAFREYSDPWPAWMGGEGGAVRRAQPLSPQSGLRGAHSPTVPFPFPIPRGPTPPSQVRRPTPQPQVYPKAPSPRTRAPLTLHRPPTRRRRCRRPQCVLTRRTRPRTTLSAARVLAARPRLYISSAKRAGSSSSGDASSQACAPAARGSLGAGAAPGSSPKSNSSCSQGAMARAKPASRPHALTDAPPNRPGGAARGRGGRGCSGEPWGSLPPSLPQLQGGGVPANGRRLGAPARSLIHVRLMGRAGCAGSLASVLR